jgi:uncharacterized membrane protein
MMKFFPSRAAKLLFRVPKTNSVNGVGPGSPRVPPLFDAGSSIAVGRSVLDSPSHEPLESCESPEVDMQQQNNRNWQPSQRLAVGLGWFSVGLGLAEIAAPRALARLIGVQPDGQAVSVLRAFGAREIANGVAILSEPDRAAWLWGRVGGDTIDLLSLMQASKTDRGRTIAATGAVLGVTALDVLCATQLSAAGADARQPREVQITEATTVNRSVEEVYAFWRNFENFPRFMRHIESVETSGRTSHWRARGPAGIKVEWDAELVEDVENQRVSWRTLENSDVEHHGSVRFARAPGLRGTEVWVHLHYSPPAGQLGRGIAWLLGSDPEPQIKEDLRRFKQIVETGEVTLSDGPALWRPAQPVDEPERLKTLAGVHS